MNDKTYKTVCFQCERSNIEHKCWVDVNSDEVLDNCSDNEAQDQWCRDCENHVKFLTKEL